MNLSEIRQRRAKATEGPWNYDTEAYGPSDCIITTTVPQPPYGGTGIAYEVCEKNADFIAHSWQDIGDLLELLDEARERLDLMRSDLVDHNDDCPTGVAAFVTSVDVLLAKLDGGLG